MNCPWKLTSHVFKATVQNDILTFIMVGSQAGCLGEEGGMHPHVPVCVSPALAFPSASPLKKYIYKRATGISSNLGIRCYTNIPSKSPFPAARSSQITAYRDKMQATTPPVVYCNASGSSTGKESPCNAGDPVQFLGREDPLEKG